MNKVEEYEDLFAQYEFEPTEQGNEVLVDKKNCCRVKYRIVEWESGYFHIQLPPVGARQSWITVGTFTTRQNAEEFILLKLSEEKKNGSTNEEDDLPGGCD